MQHEIEDSNPTPHPRLPERRTLLQGGLSLLAAAPFAALAAARDVAPPPRLGFKPVPPSTADAVIVPDGYVAEVLYAWGDPVGTPLGQPAFRADASNSAAEQALQAGMHHDGMHFFPLARDRGLLVMNHEYADDGLLHTDGMAEWSAEKVRKSQAAHGVSVIEVQRARDGSWTVLRPSRYARRITASTPMRIAGPAAGHALMRTALDPTGTQVLGTFNNCAHGATPWGTYLACEENVVGYFRGPQQPDAHQRRWGLGPRTYGYRWEEHDERFDAVKHPNEFNRHGWVVEIDPFDPASTPVKRTALGRAAHEGACVLQAADGRVAVYMGEDAAFESIYKFVSRDAARPGGFAANRDLLDHGTLYVARFDADGSGVWLPLVAGTPGLEAFADQGELLVKTRQASAAAGATRMDRPEWIAGDATTATLYCALTNNAARGQPGQPGVDAANPRASNAMGGVLRWVESDGLAGTRFRWDHFILAGDPATTRPEAQGKLVGDAFGCPDGLMLDARGLLWIQTDVSPSALGQGEYARLGNTQMLACDPASGEVRRVLTGPVGCEITGAVMAPDQRSLFVNIQHPGETPRSRSNPAAPMRQSRWPQGYGPGGRPRSATVVVRRRDGGVIGS